MRRVHDDLGHPIWLDGPVGRVVSLVPSITEAVHSARPSALVGATDWCTHPSDLVVANKEENRELDVRRLRNAGISVWVTDIETVPQAIASLERLFDDALQWPRPPWLCQARELWCGPVPPATQRVAIAVWRDPWMVVGRSTFTGDLAKRLGMENIFAEHRDRYPTVLLEELDEGGADFVLLPDEPYVFTHEDGPEAFTHTSTRLVSGRLLTWYRPSLIQAQHTLRDPVGIPTKTEEKQ